MLDKKHFSNLRGSLLLFRHLGFIHFFSKSRGHRTPEWCTWALDVPWIMKCLDLYSANPFATTPLSFTFLCVLKSVSYVICVGLIKTQLKTVTKTMICFFQSVKLKIGLIAYWSSLFHRRNYLRYSPQQLFLHAKEPYLDIISGGFRSAF